MHSSVRAVNRMCILETMVVPFSVEVMAVLMLRGKKNGSFGSKVGSWEQVSTLLSVISALGWSLAWKWSATIAHD